MGSVAFAGLSAARSRVSILADALRRAGSGEVVEKAAAKIQEQIDAVANGRIVRHVDSGAAKNSLVVRTAGSLVTLSANRYLDFHSWWPFRRGMPPFVLKRAAQILAATLLELLGDRSSVVGAIAGEVLDEAAAGEAKKAAAKNERETEKAAAKRESKIRREGRKALTREARDVERSRAQFKKDTARQARREAAHARRAAKRKG